MSREQRNEFGDKTHVRVIIRGQGELSRTFPNKGKAIEYLMKEGYTRDDIKNFVRFVSC